MEAFRYRALDAAGRTVSGVVQADTARQARSQLRAQGMLPCSVDPVHALTQRRLVRGISAAELNLVTRQMATLLSSGLTMEQALAAVIEQASEAGTREVLSSVMAELAAGASLAGALGSYEKSFPEFYRALVNGGEESGALPLVLEHLADYLEARQALQQKTQLALLYPILVTLVALAIVGGLLIYVVPQIVQVFQQSRQSLPVPTRVLIAVSNFLHASWLYIASILVIGVVSARVALRRAGVRRRWDAFLLRLPALGSLIRSLEASRFASMLAILIEGGVPMLAALATGARVMTNTVMSDAAEIAIARVREGVTLARALGAAQAFPPLLMHLVASGESSGKLTVMLKRAARLETQSLERRLAVFLTLLEPAMILLMGGVVLSIVLAILLPIIELNQLVR